MLRVDYVGIRNLDAKLCSGDDGLKLKPGLPVQEGLAYCSITYMESYTARYTDGREYADGLDAVRWP